MPFGTKPDASGVPIDFDAVFEEIIVPAIEDADLDSIRADREVSGGIIHKPMFERLVLCEYAVADLTTANANVFYELGVRHAVRPFSTVLIFASGRPLPFDVAPMRGLPYGLDDQGGPRDVAAARAALTERLEAARAAQTDSPVFQLVDGLAPPPIERLKTDTFRDRADYSERVKRDLKQARAGGPHAVRAAADRLGPIEDVELGVLVDLLLSYRAVGAWKEMVALVEEMPPPLAESSLVQEQRALALNRLGRSDEAEEVLKEVLQRRGPSSETLGILGRVYKDRWERARDGQPELARQLLDDAIAVYRKGFEADWRDAYPGVNAVTLMELRDPPDPQRLDLLPVVRYANRRREETETADYWDHATRLELDVIAKDQQDASVTLGRALAKAREPWELRSTINNLQLIREERERRGERVPWTAEVEQALERRAEELEMKPQSGS
jgi:tetratricopeptide (TPR) repeat protein